MDNLKNWIIDGSLAILVLVLTILLYEKIIIATILITIIAITYLLIHKSKIMWKIFLSAAILGTAAEVLAVYFGVWEYAKPNLINVPLWLIPVWGCAGIFAYRAGINLRKEKNE
jgi:hypothetical protein